MHPDAPEWARELLGREMPSADLRRFVVLKDGPVQKLAFAYADDGLYVVQRTVAGGEIFHVAWGAAGARARCATCGAAFRFEGDVGALHCVACGARIEPLGGAPASVARHAFEDLEGIGDAHADALVGAGVPDRAALARADADLVRKATGADPATVAAWQGAARLLELAALTGTDARALAEAGVRDVADLARRDAETIAAAAGVPADRALAWIEAARGLR